MTTTRPRALRVRDVYTRDPAAARPGDTVVELARILAANQISGVPIVDELDRVIGVISKTDLLHRCLEGPSGTRPSAFFELLASGFEGNTDFGFDSEELGVAEDFMSTDLVTVSPDDTLSVAAARMADACVHRVIVVDEGGHLLGIATALDLLRVYP